MQDQNNGSSSNHGSSDGAAPGRSRRRSRARAGGALVVEQAGRVSTPAAQALDEAARAARLELLERLAGDVRTLVMLARSAALPPARRLDEMERTVARHLESLRADAASGA